MKPPILLFIIFLKCVTAFSQVFNIGHCQMNFVDSSRSNRPVSADVYYPAISAGENVAVASAVFPVLAFGHGFVMSVSSYQTVWDSLVPHGYIMVFPTTESSFSPSHSDFGKDLAFVIKAMKKENITSSSLFYGSVGSTSAAMGHSMGGGSAFLAMQLDTTITAFATMAAAETTPSAIYAGMQVTKPALVVSGANDCVAPAAQHQQPMYDSLASACKTFLSIIGGSHCQFADYSTTCYFGEGTCTPQATITASAQHQLSMSLILPWLNFYLKNDCNAGTVFQNGITNNALVSTLQNCSLQCMTTFADDYSKDSNVQLFPNPCSNEFKIMGCAKAIDSILLSDISGRTIKRIVNKGSDMLKIDTSDLKDGVYLIHMKTESGTSISRKIIVQH